jgi:hypothetical protein
MTQTTLDPRPWHAEPSLTHTVSRGVSGRQASESQAQASPRHDGYAFVHKGLRAFMCETLTATGCMDPDDPAAVTRTLGMVRQLLEACRKHLEHENTHVHTAMEARRPGSSTCTAQEHVEHTRAIEALAAVVQAVDHSAGAMRAALAARLYRQLALFVADNLLHMHTEEVDNSRVLWDAYTDEELLDIEHAIRSSIPPAQMMMFLRWMLPALSSGERAQMLQGMRQGVPAAVFQQVLAMVRPHLSDREWNKLCAALEI